MSRMAARHSPITLPSSTRVRLTIDRSQYGGFIVASLLNGSGSGELVPARSGREAVRNCCDPRLRFRRRTAQGSGEADDQARETELETDLAVGIVRFHDTPSPSW